MSPVQARRRRRQGAFSSLAAATTAAVAAQRAIAAEAWLETGSLRVRMASHLGQANPDARYPPIHGERVTSEFGEDGRSPHSHVLENVYLNSSARKNPVGSFELAPKAPRRFGLLLDHGGTLSPLLGSTWVRVTPAWQQSWRQEVKA
jgi:hypothetical protein